MKFMIAYDGSNNAKEAILYVLPYLGGHEVTIYSCFQPDTSFFYESQEYAEEYVNDGYAKADALCQEAANMITSQTGLCSVQRLVELIDNKTEIAHVLVSAAAQADADLIVLGTRGQGEVKSKLFGSVAQGVLFETADMVQERIIPVLIVHEGAAALREANGHKVLFPVDCTDKSLLAVDRSAPFVRADSEVYFFHAYDAPQKYMVIPSFGIGGSTTGGSAVVVNECYEDEKKRTDEHNQFVEHQARQHLGMMMESAGVEIPRENVHFMVFGSNNPRSGVEQCQRVNKVDLVVVRTRSERGMSRLIHGSLAHHLLHESEAFAMLITH